MINRWGMDGIMIVHSPVAYGVKVPGIILFNLRIIINFQKLLYLRDSNCSRN